MAVILHFTVLSGPARNRFPTRLPVIPKLAPDLAGLSKDRSEVTERDPAIDQQGLSGHIP
jgi:hypothetical protein